MALRDEDMPAIAQGLAVSSSMQSITLSLNILSDVTLVRGYPVNT